MSRRIANASCRSTRASAAVARTSSRSPERIARRSRVTGEPCAVMRTDVRMTVTRQAAAQPGGPLAVLLCADLAAREALGQDVLRVRAAPRAAAAPPQQHERRDQQGPDDGGEDPPVVMVSVHVAFYL